MGMIRRKRKQIDWMSLGEVSEFMGLSKHRVRQLADQGVIPCHRFGKRGHRRFDPDQIKFIYNRPKPCPFEIARNLGYDAHEMRFKND